MDRNQKGVSHMREATVRHTSFNPVPPTRPVSHSSPLHTFGSGFESIPGLTQSLTESEPVQPHRSHTQVFLNHPAISNSPRYFLIKLTMKKMIPEFSKTVHKFCSLRTGRTIRAQTCAPHWEIHSALSYSREIAAFYFPGIICTI